MSKSFLKKALLGGAVAAGAAVWAIAPRSFSDKRRHYVPAVPDVWYAHRGLHDAGSGLTAQYANESGEYVALARRMAMKAGYGSPDTPGVIAPENSLAAFAAACEAGYGIELDLQMTRDGEVVVVHDGALMRVAAAGHHAGQRAGRLLPACAAIRRRAQSGRRPRAADRGI